MVVAEVIALAVVTEIAGTNAQTVVLNGVALPQGVVIAVKNKGVYLFI